jgi:hypothetical protein
MSKMTKLARKEEIEIEAFSQSINKTIKELEALVRGERVIPNGKLRANLHAVLFKLLRQKARFWYHRGFKRGHESAHRKSKKVPLEMLRPMRMRFAFSPNETYRIVLHSKLRA